MPSTLFHGFNPSWKGNKVKFRFLPVQSNAAKMIVNGLIPYVHFKYGNEDLDFFVPNDVQTKAVWTWDDANKVIINSLSKDLDTLDEADEDYNFVP